MKYQKGNQGKFKQLFKIFLYSNIQEFFVSGTSEFLQKCIPVYYKIPAVSIGMLVVHDEGIIADRYLQNKNKRERHLQVMNHVSAFLFFW